MKDLVIDWAAIKRNERKRLRSNAVNALASMNEKLARVNLLAERLRRQTARRGPKVVRRLFERRSNGAAQRRGR
jgi:hypothetical protein